MQPIRVTIILSAVSSMAALLSPPGHAQSAKSSDGREAEEVVELQRLEILGTRDEGYVSRISPQVGPLVGREPLDTPLSINVMPDSLIRNLQAVAPDDLFKVNPVTQFNNPQSRFFTGVTLRGFSIGSTKRIDGTPSVHSYVNTDLEDKDRVEVITGLSGFLNGAGNVGGTLNYVLKRPTVESLRRLTVGLNGGMNAYAHADLGGSLDSARRFGYRLNVALQDGDTAVDHQAIERRFASGAFDWNITRDLRLQIDASVTDYRMEGTEPYWSAATGVAYPDAPDPDNFYGQPFTYSESEQHHVGASLSWKINDVVSLRTRVSRRESELELSVVNNTFVAGDPGDYQVQASAWEYPDITAVGGYAFLDAVFDTGPLSHRATAGYFGDTDERTNFRSSPGGWATITFTEGFNVAKPVYVDAPPLAPTSAKYRAQRSQYHNLVLGDDIRLGDRWSALVGVNRATIADRTFGASGTVAADYDESKVTPTYALLFKPVADVSLYLSSMESFEKGGTAAATYGGYPVVNANETMPPLISEQLEAGLKARWRKAFLTLALFEIDKGLQYYDIAVPEAPVYVQSGRQVHRGVELTVSGEVVSGLTVVGGVTAMEAEVAKNRQNPSLVGKTPTNVAERMAKLYAEYAITAVPGLVVTGGLYYTGGQFADQANAIELPSFVTGDLGLRYQTFVVERPVTFRISVNNVTNERYWLTSSYVGARRTLLASTSIDF